MRGSSISNIDLRLGLFRFIQLSIIAATTFANLYTMEIVSVQRRLGIISMPLMTAKQKADADYQSFCFDSSMQFSAAEWQQYNKADFVSVLMAVIAAAGIGLGQMHRDCYHRVSNDSERLLAVLYCVPLVLNAFAYYGIAEWRVEKIESFVEKLWYNSRYQALCLDQGRQAECDSVNPLFRAPGKPLSLVEDFKKYRMWTPMDPLPILAVALAMIAAVSLIYTMVACCKPERRRNAHLVYGSQNITQSAYLLSIVL